MIDKRTSDDIGSSPTTAAFEVLRDPSRRFLIRYLLRTESSIVEHETLVEGLIDRFDGDVDRQTIVTALRHVHLPKMADAGVIEYDSGDDIVRIDRSTVGKCLERVQVAVEELETA